MKERSDRLGYGAWLREARKRKGMSLAEVSEVIRIDEPYLRALESGNIAVLPEPYIRAFLKTYVGYLGLDDQEARERFDLFVREQQERLDDVRAAAREKEGRRLPDGSRVPTRTAPAAEGAGKAFTAGDRRGGRWLIAVFVVLGIGAAAYLAVRLTGGFDIDPGDGGSVPATEQPVTSPPLLQEQGSGAGATATGIEGTPVDEPQTATPTPPTFTTTRSHLLVIDASEATWIQAVTGRDTLVSRIVPAGGRVQIPFADTLHIRAGKNWSLRMTLDGRELTGLGPEGYVLSSLILTGEGIVTRRLSLPRDEPPPGVPNRL